MVLVISIISETNALEKCVEVLVCQTIKVPPSAQLSVSDGKTRHIRRTAVKLDELLGDLCDVYQLKSW